MGEREDMVGEAAKQKTKIGVGDEIGQDRYKKTTSRPSGRRMQQGLESPGKDGCREEPSADFGDFGSRARVPT